MALLAGGWMTAARASATEGTDAVAEGGAGGPTSVPEAPYAAYSNDALTALAARWDTLDVHERRALLTEVRQRMAQSGAQPGSGVIEIRTERRYGRIIRQADGRFIRIETRVVHVQPLPESALSGGYGVGFERRAGSSPPIQTAGATVAPASAPAPVPADAVNPSTAPALQSVP